MEDDLNNVSLSDLQLAIMRALWQKPNSTTTEVVEAVRESRPLAHTTIATLLTRLEKRGLVEVKRDGRQLCYRALLSESQVKRSMVSDLVSSLFMGNPSALLSHLVKEQEIDETELEAIRTMLEKKRK
ncbi:BlaI/MecI/CopY family transcriptional regulator [Undibacterium cyanobacteriorum]|uniref:BlaI/MecI/CopY family transcriptional regulator n=1 Tax=Undibacterium cyanobacteriorum TaxID=3073561 RepID=A0ABY9RMA7_9BURK|nr:BlaI/MecI/CopY family transcriptional regulator [Undibacterium sp. 20NA77.5]WMW81415.1 BlaI/MecI/CopY family transcriptional regulator [Undibacterium sp. 20NA77.5]